MEWINLQTMIREKSNFVVKKDWKTEKKVFHVFLIKLKLRLTNKREQWKFRRRIKEEKYVKDKTENSNFKSTNLFRNW